MVSKGRKFSWKSPLRLDIATSPPNFSGGVTRYNTITYSNHLKYGNSALFSNSYLHISLAFIIFLVSLSFAADVPRTMSYQGKVTDMSGVAINGVHSFRFSIYDAETGGTSLWSETHATVSVSKGLFSVILGETAPINLRFDRQYWLQIQVDAIVLNPRLPFSNSSYAFRAIWADSVIGMVSSQDSFIAYWDSIRGIPADIIDGDSIGLRQIRADDNVWLTDSVSLISGTGITMMQTGSSIMITSSATGTSRGDTMIAYWDSIRGIPPGLADGIDNAGDADSIVGNEYNTALAFNETTDSLYLTDGGGILRTAINIHADNLGDNSINDLSDVNTAGALNGQVLKWNTLSGAWLPANDSSIGDNWGTQAVQHDASLLGDGTAANPLTVSGSGVISAQYIWNQDSMAQTAKFRISGTARAETLASNNIRPATGDTVKILGNARIIQSLFIGNVPTDALHDSVLTIDNGQVKKVAARDLRVGYADSAYIAHFADSSRKAWFADTARTAKFADSSRVTKYADSTRIARYADSTRIAATARYADSTRVAARADSARVAARADSARVAAYADSARIAGYSYHAQNADTADYVRHGVMPTGYIWNQDSVAQPAKIRISGNVSADTLIVNNIKGQGYVAMSYSGSPIAISSGGFIILFSSAYTAAGSGSGITVSFTGTFDDRANLKGAGMEIQLVRDPGAGEVVLTSQNEILANRDVFTDKIVTLNAMDFPAAGTHTYATRARMAYAPLDAGRFVQGNIQIIEIKH